MESGKSGKIGSLNGLKVIAMLLLFWWHSSLPKCPCDLGARTCEFFFVVSGFLVAYNHSSDRRLPATPQRAFRYLGTKVAGTWPLHLICFLISCWNLAPLTMDRNMLYTMITNLFMFQAWSLDEKVYFSFNGASWFLSALLFCYFMSVFLMVFVQKKWDRNRMLLFFLTFSVRFLIERLPHVLDLNLWSLNIHCNPFVRCLEFFLGMQLYSFAEWLDEKREYLGTHRRIAENVAELSVLVFIVCVSLAGNVVLDRSIFVLCMCLLISVFAAGGGMVSDFLSSRIFAYLGRYQLAFFLFHQVIIKSCLGRLNERLENSYLSNLIVFLIICICSWVYMRFLHGYFTEKMCSGMEAVHRAFFEEEAC